LDVATDRVALPAGDDAVRTDEGAIIAAVARKGLENLASGLSDGTLDIITLAGAVVLAVRSLLSRRRGAGQPSLARIRSWSAENSTSRFLAAAAYFAGRIC
jgi:hypothetical protein